MSEATEFETIDAAIETKDDQEKTIKTAIETTDDQEKTIKTAMDREDVEMQNLMDENAQLRADLEEVSLKLATIREILFDFMNKNYKL